MKKTAIILLIVALVSLLSILATGCEEEGKQTAPVSGVQKYNTPAEPADAAKSESGAAETKAASSARAEAVDIVVYFSDDQAEYLAPEIRHVAQADNLAMAVVEELIKGPQEKDHFATIPSETSVRGVEIQDRIAYVNFSKELIEKHWGGSAGELMTITSIVNSLTEFDDIQKVQILVDGKVVETIAGHSDVSKPLARDETKIKK